jgi:hypothetical protein
MAVLKERQSGGYFLLGPAYPGTPMATWQLGQPGLNYLRSHGVEIGSRVPVPIMAELREHGWIWTGGSGVGDATDPEDIPEPVIEELIAWGTTGYVDDLIEALRVTHLSLPHCITEAFISWLLGYEEGVRLHDLVEVSLSDFNSYLRGRSTYTLNALHFQLAETEGGNRVLWHWTRMIAHVEHYLANIQQMPSSWQGTIYEMVTNLLQEILTPSQRERSAAKPRKQQPAPYLCWKVHDQEVGIVLPAQSIKREEKLSWKVEQEEWIHPKVRNLPDRMLSEESYSDPLEFSPAWKIEVHVTKADNPPEITPHQIQLPSNTSYVLFDSQGKLVDAEEELSSGDYLVLEAPDPEGVPLEDLRGVTLIEEFDFEPWGWEGWTGHLLCLNPGVRLGAYRISGQRHAIEWKLEQAENSEVDFSQPTPVFTGRWPRILISTSDELLLHDARVVVEENYSRKKVTLPLTVNASVTSPDDLLIEEEDEFILDLNRARDIAGLSGIFEVRLFLSSQPRSSDLEPIQFVALPDTQLGYVEDPIHPQESRALLVETQASAIADERCRIEREENGRYFISSEDPIREPMANFTLTFSSPKIEIPLSVRLPTSRAAVLSREDRVPDWKPLPIQVSLFDIHLNSRIKLELCDAPETSVSDELVCRRPDGQLLIAGKQSGNSSAFYIPLYNWQENIGIQTSTQIQVSCGDRWIPLADVQGRGENRTPRPEPPVEIVDPYQQLMQELDECVVDQQQAMRVFEKIRGLLEEQNCPAWFADLFQIRVVRSHLFWGELDKAQDRLDDLREKESLAGDVERFETLIRLRSETLDEYGILEAERVISNWEEGPEKQLARAECAYRLSRVGSGGRGGLDACARILQDWGSGGPIDRIEACQLHALVRFLLDEFVDSENSTILGCWGDILSESSRYLHQPLGTFHPDRVAELDASWPSIWCRRDCQYIAAVLGQERGMGIQDCRNYLDDLERVMICFPRKELLIARQLKQDQKEREALGLYQEILHSRDTYRGYDVVLNEMY